VVERVWMRYALRMGLSSAALSNGKCPLFYAFVPKAACFSKFPILRFSATWCRVLAAHARLPWFLALMMPHRVETSACMF